MKKLLLVCCIVIGVSSLSRAQGGGGGGRGGARTPEAQTAALKTSLSLTDAQAAKVLAIYQGQTKSMDSLRTAGGDMMTAMRPLMTATTAKIKAVLTPEQAVTFQKQQDDRMKMMQGGGGMGGGGGTPPPPSKQ
jgi:periplasmic protein CpxP/Spy